MNVFRILIQISLKFVPRCPVDNKSALEQVMAWRRRGDKLLPSSLTHNRVTGGRWVKVVTQLLVAFHILVTFHSSLPWLESRKTCLGRHCQFQWNILLNSFSIHTFHRKDWERNLPMLTSILHGTTWIALLTEVNAKPEMLTDLSTRYALQLKTVLKHGLYLGTILLC